jgi:hypothetical protein
MGAGIGFGFGLHQYREGQRQYQQGQNWKKAEVILGLIDSFKDDPKIQAACLMLDWDQRTIEINEHITFPFHNNMLIQALRIIWLNDKDKIPLDVVTEGLDVQGPNSDGFTKNDALIRDCFDAFFDFFDKVNAFRHSALVEWPDLSYFVYWLALVQRIGESKYNPAIQKTIDDYLSAYDFKGFLELKEEYRLLTISTKL